MSHRKFLLCALALVFACTSTESGDEAQSNTTSSEHAPTQAPVPEPTKPQAPVGDPRDAVALAEGGGFSCVLQRAGTVACWGDNEWGVLGQDHHDAVEGAVLVRGLDDAVAISASGGAACALRRTGPVVCWGDPSRGELGNGKTGEPRGLVEVVGVHDVTGLFGGSSESCATTASGRAWCWGLAPEGAPLYDPPSDQTWGPHPLELDGVRALHLGYRWVAYRADGSVLVWNHSRPPTTLHDVVEVKSSSLSTVECIVRSSGDVACTHGGKREVVVESLRGARQLSIPRLTWEQENYVVVGILPDGALATGSINGKPTPTFIDARNLVALAPEHSWKLTAIRRDGRVFEWVPEFGNDPYHPREIVLPKPSTVGPAIPPVAPLDPPLPTSSLPSWCSVEIHKTFPRDWRSWEEMAKLIDSRHSESLCESSLDEVINSDSSGCLVGGPWLVLQEDLDIALVVQLDGNRVGRIRELASYGEDGVEAVGWKIRSSIPVHAWLHVAEGNTHRHVVLTELAKGDYLRTDVTIDMQAAKPDRKFDAPTIEIADGMVDVSACGGRYRAPLPLGVREFVTRE
jgi:hypothetical protein